MDRAIRAERGSMGGTEQPTVRVLVADDHELARSGLRAMLAAEPDLRIVGEVSNGREALERCRLLHPDVVMMDVRMPDMDGLAATRAIKSEMPEVAVIILTMHENRDYLLEALKVGAAGYLLKDASQAEVAGALRAVVRGEALLQPRTMTLLLRRLAADLPERREDRPESLSARELEVLQLLARGLTNREIGEALTISPGTAKVHVEHIIAKLRVSDRTQAAVRALRLGLASGD
jgi:DNA-binding NarL/FixJ family response regulator